MGSTDVLPADQDRQRTHAIETQIDELVVNARRTTAQNDAASNAPQEHRRFAGDPQTPAASGRASGSLCEVETYLVDLVPPVAAGCFVATGLLPLSG